MFHEDVLHPKSGLETFSCGYLTGVEKKRTKSSHERQQHLLWLSRTGEMSQILLQTVKQLCRILKAEDAGDRQRRSPHLEALSDFTNFLVSSLQICTRQAMWVRICPRPRNASLVLSCAKRLFSRVCTLVRKGTPRFRHTLRHWDKRTGKV